jgi:hypothetical protein
MKHWPPLPAPSDKPLRRRRIPAFHPVPVGHRQDGWTPRRQAAFVGYLAETRSVEGACRRVRMGKESAYRLRKRPGAAGFAAAWDAALGKPHAAVDLSSAKSTGLDAAYRHEMGLLQVVMSAGRYAGSHWKEDANALLQHLAHCERSSRHMPEFEGKPRRLQPGDVSGPGVDFGSEFGPDPGGEGAPLLAPAVDGR